MCVITGTASGIGAETAALFRAEGAAVVGVDLHESPDVDRSLRVDVADEGAVAGMYRAVREEVVPAR